MLTFIDCHDHDGIFDITCMGCMYLFVWIFVMSFQHYNNHVVHGTSEMKWNENQHTHTNSCEIHSHITFTQHTTHSHNTFTQHIRTTHFSPTHFNPTPTIVQYMQKCIHIHTSIHIFSHLHTSIRTSGNVCNWIELNANLWSPMFLNAFSIRTPYCTMHWMRREEKEREEKNLSEVLRDLRYLAIG